MNAFATRTIEAVTQTLIDYRGKTPTKTASGVKLITAKVVKDGFIQDGEHEYIAEADYNAWMRRGLPRQWDILITTEAPLGELAQLRSPERIALAQRIILLRGDPTLIDQNYYFHALKSPFVQSGLKARSSGTTVLGIKQSELRQVEVPRPPLPIQKRIASILSAYDDLIENNTRRIKILEEMARMLYREWFVNFRFPGHEKVPMVDSKLGPIPDQWAVDCLEAGCQRITDGSHWSPPTVESPHRMASSKDMHRWGLDLSTARRISKTDFDSLVRNDCRPLAGDVLITKDGANYLKFCFVVEKDMDVVLLSSIAMVRPDPMRLCPHFLAFYLSDPSVKTRLAGRVSGAAIPRIVLQDFRHFNVLVPPIMIQKGFVDYVEPIVGLCWRLVDKNTNLRTTRDLLLPKLISGEIPVEAAAELVEQTA